MHFRLKKFFSYYKPYLGLFIAVLTGAALVAASTLIFPLLTRYITKNVLEGGMAHALNEIVRVGVLMLAVILLQNAFNYFVDYRGHAMGAMMERDMRNELFHHLQKLPFSFYDSQKTGKLMSRLTNDLLSLSELYHHGPEDYVVYLIRFIGAFVILLTINVPLTLAVFAFLPVMAFYELHYNRRIGKAIKTSQARIGDINAQAEESLAGIRVVKSFTNEAQEEQKFIRENERFLDSRKSIYRNEAFLFNGVNVFTQLITLTVIVAGGISIVNGKLDLADLITFLLYIGNFVEPIKKLTHVTTQFQQGIASFERFMEILDIQPDIRDAEGAVAVRNVKGAVQFRQVGFRYHEDHDYVLENLSLDVKAGEYVALVGSSGVGKTTLCSLIPRFYEVTEGDVLLDGISIKAITLESLRASIGVVQQDVYLFSGSVYDNIRYGKPGATREEILKAARDANAHDFIMKLPNGYDTDIGQRGVKLSGGQKQRLSIARVFLKNPPVLIFDEATSSLDYESERVVQESLEALSKNRTTFVIAHRLSTIRNAKRILVLTEQGITEEGTHEELIARNGAYAHLYSMQTKM